MFPRKFKGLIEIELVDVPSPDYIWLVYAVCAASDDACGWGGWIIEAAFQKSDGSHPTSTGDKPLPAQGYEQICPRCGLDLFRTSASIRMAPSEDQKPPLEVGKDYEAVPIEYSG